MFSHGRYLFLCLYIITLGACASKQHGIHGSLNKKQIFADDSLDQAKRRDIPTPLSYRLVAKKVHHATEFLTYHGTLSVQKTYDFYRKEMERLGWDLVDFSYDQECLLVCSKTNKHCAVTIESLKKNKTLLKIAIKTIVMTAPQATIIFDNEEIES